MLITIDGQSPTSRMSPTTGEEGDYPATPPPTPFGTPHPGTPYLLSGKFKTGDDNEAGTNNK